MKKIDVRKIIFKYVNKVKSLIKYDFEEVIQKVVPKNYYAVAKDEHEKDIKEGVALVCFSLILIKFLVILMNFCIFFKANKVLGEFSYVFRITYETIIMKDLASIIVSSLALIVIPILFLIYVLRYHGGRQKTNIYFAMLIFSLLMILKKCYDIIVAFGTITDSLIVMILVMVLYVVAAVGYISILKGCLDFCLYAYDESKKELIKPENEDINVPTNETVKPIEEINMLQNKEVIYQNDEKTTTL